MGAGGPRRRGRHRSADASSVLGALESIDVVYSQSWQYDDAVARLAERLGASPARRRYSGIGGSVPLVLATEVAREIRAGDLDLALITGAEALATVRRLKKAGEKPQWSFRPAEKRPFPMDMDFDPSEISHAVFEAYLTFALFDNARRAHLGRGLDEHRARLGRVLAPMTEIAAASPHAWFPVARGADEIVTATPDNRMVAYPYTKLMTSIMDVDMAAALVLASAAKADALGRARGAAGLPARLRPTPRTLPTWPATPSCGAPPPWPPRPAPRWPAPASASTTWPTSTSTPASPARCASRSTRWGSARTTPRAVTQTGGLPYHGGPGSNYMTHSLAAMVETLRARPRLLRRDERRRHAHAEARLRRVVDRPGRRARRPTRRRAAARGRRRWPSSSRPRARPPSPPTRSCTAATAGPSAPCWSATCPEAAAATPCSTAGPRRWPGPRPTS